ncbi:MAG: hypothetical protein ACYTGK_17605, partial [Planctomycetota bacterium]
MGDTYFDWFRTTPGRPDSFPQLDDGQRAALDEMAASHAASPWTARATAPGGPPAGGSPTASASEYLLDTTVAMTSFESFAGAESWAAGAGELLIGETELTTEAVASIPDYGGDIHRVENIGS